MMNDLDIKNKRILLFDFDGTLIETASGNTFATDLTDMRIKMDVLNIRIDKDQNFNLYSDVIKIETLKDSKNKDVVYIPYSYEDDVKKVTSQVRDLDVVYVLDVSFGADSKTVFKK